MKFKVGDRVKIIKSRVEKDCFLKCVGTIGTITSVISGGIYRLDANNYNWFEDEIELVEEKKPEPKFKVGDKVRIVAVKHCQSMYKNRIGAEFTVKTVFPDDCSYFLNEPVRYIWTEEELELVTKSKFDISKYVGMYAMCCKTQEQADVFYKYMRTATDNYSVDGFSLNISAMWSKYKSDTCYFFNEDMFSTDIHKGYTYLNFEDFDWSDFMSKKEFTKKDLRDGDVVKLRSGAIRIVLLDKKCLLDKHTGGYKLDNIEDDLTHNCVEECDIMAVRRINDPELINFSAFAIGRGELVYERKEAEEMTLAEVCKALGKEIKIVKEK